MTPERTYAQAERARSHDDTPHWPTRWQRLIDKLRIVQDWGEMQSLEDSLAHVERPVTVAFLNAHAMNLAVKDPTFFSHLMEADILLRDGVGVTILLRMLGKRPGLNMNGTDFIPRILDRHKTSRIALFGTLPAYLERAVEVLRKSGHAHVDTTLDGFQPDASYALVTSKVKPEVIVLGMGMPKQEKIAAQLRQTGGGPRLTICGGAVLDFIGGRVCRAPALIRRMRLEWLYRLVLEPKRLFRRYVIGNPLFLWRAFQVVLAAEQGRRDQ